MFYRIVVATDFSECAQEAWAMARRIATAPGSELVLAHVLTDVPLYGEGFFNIETARKAREGARKWAEGALESWVGKARAEGLSARAVAGCAVVAPLASDHALETMNHVSHS